MHTPNNKTQRGLIWPVLLGLVVCGASLGAQAANLRVMKQGIGSGTVTSTTAGINCGADCDEPYAAGLTITLNATPAAGSMFAGWEGDCAGLGSCVVNTSLARSVRAQFVPSPPSPASRASPQRVLRPFSPPTQHHNPAQFVKALPDEFKQNWLLMTRSESLQTGTAAMPRILMPSANTQFVFSLGLATHSAYPGAHPNAIEYMQWDPAEKTFASMKLSWHQYQPWDQCPPAAGV